MDERLEQLVASNQMDRETALIFDMLPPIPKRVMIEKYRPKQPSFTIQTPNRLIVNKKDIKRHRQTLIESIEGLLEKLNIENRLRRNPGAGSVFQRKDKDRPTPYWCGFVDLAPDPATGKRRRKKFRGATREDVLAKMDPHVFNDPKYESNDEAKSERMRRLSASSFQALERLNGNLQEMLEHKNNRMERDGA